MTIVPDTHGSALRASGTTSVLILRPPIYECFIRASSDANKFHPNLLGPEGDHSLFGPTANRGSIERAFTHVGSIAEPCGSTCEAVSDDDGEAVASPDCVLEVLAGFRRSDWSASCTTSASRRGTRSCPALAERVVRDAGEGAVVELRKK
jgi:hypothetical protein